MLGRDKKTAVTTGASSQDYRNHTLIAPSATVRGDIEFSGGLHIQGTVEGNVSVGKDGGRLKRIGSNAREDMERSFQTKVMLNLWVKVKSGWADDERALQSLGYIEPT